MQEIRNYARSNSAHLEPRELLQAPVSVLLGVRAAAVAALRTIQISTVFDLATSRIFRNAAAINEAGETSGNVFGRFGTVSADMLDENARNIDLAELAEKDIQTLDGIGPVNGPALVSGLTVNVIRELALWPPYLAARDILTQVLLPEETAGFDPEAPADLLPKSGEYPTEKVFYRTVVIDEIEDQVTGAIDSPIDIAAPALKGEFKKPATGAIIQMEQSWYAQAVALGNLLHSVALAPGESTKIAVIDWSRRMAGTSDESVSQAESLTNETTHSRSISEVTSAVANEAQSGFSRTTTVGAAAEVGLGAGGLLSGVLVGAAGGVSTTVSSAASVSGSQGRRELAANMTQRATDRTQQHANSARNRRASIIQEVEQGESETVTTRSVTNYNHMHALSVQYYEVVQIYRVTTNVSDVEKCLFVPMKVIENWTPELIRRHREALLLAVPSGPIRQALGESKDMVRVAALNPLFYPTANQDAGRIEELQTAREATGQMVAPDSVSEWNLPANTRLTSIDLQSPALSCSEVFITMRDGSTQSVATTLSLSRVKANFNEPFVLSEIASITFPVHEIFGDDVSPEDFLDTREFSAQLYFRFGSRTFARQLHFPLKDNWQSYYRGKERASDRDEAGFTAYRFFVDYPALSFVAGGTAASADVASHLAANATYYSQVVWMSMDSASLSLALSPYHYNNIPLLQQIDPVPVAVTANYVGFRMNVDSNDQAASGAWKTWLREHGFENARVARHETIPLPSGGVFAEAVLGRFNSAEKLDMTRFWNWQESPIPIAAPDIAAIQTGSRQVSEPPRPGQLDAPLVAQAAPMPLPDPQGLSAIINALTASNIFRDMSGLAQTATLAQAALSAASQGASSASRQAGANLTTAAQFQIELLKAVLPLIAAAAGVPLPTGGGSSGNISNQGAILNEGRKFDQQSGAGGAQGEAASGSPAGRMSGGPTGSVGLDTFRRQTDPLASVGDFIQGVGGISEANGSFGGFPQASLASFGGGVPRGFGIEDFITGPTVHDVAPGLELPDRFRQEDKILFMNFAVNNSGLTDDHEEGLDALVKIMTNDPSINIIVFEGRASQTGGDGHNIQLSHDRAKAVRDYLVNNGISESRLGEIIGYGSALPLSNAPGQEIDANRSVVVTYQWFLPKPKIPGPSADPNASRRWTLALIASLGGGIVIGGSYLQGTLRNLETGSKRNVNMLLGGLDVGIFPVEAAASLPSEVAFETRDPLTFDDFDGCFVNVNSVSIGVVVSGNVTRVKFPNIPGPIPGMPAAAEITSTVLGVSSVQASVQVGVFNVLN